MKKSIFMMACAMGFIAMSLTGVLVAKNIQPLEAPEAQDELSCCDTLESTSGAADPAVIEPDAKTLGEISLEVHEGAKTPSGIGNYSLLGESKGLLVYSYSIFTKAGNYPTYLVAVSTPAAQEARSASAVVYSIKRLKGNVLDKKGTNVVFEPQLSKDGRYILFKYGNASSAYGQYHLYVIDRNDNSLALASSKNLTYRMVSWSPDGKYIAFVQGGDMEGGLYSPASYIGPLRLFVCDWRSRQSFLVTSNDTVRGPFYWQAPHNLLYGAMSQEGQKLFSADQERQSNNEQWQGHRQIGDAANKSGARLPQPVIPPPNIYEYSVERRVSTQLFADGYRPIPSSDGGRIAFFGLENHAELKQQMRLGWEDDPSGFALSVANSDGSQRTAISRYGGGPYPFAQWLHGNSHLITLEQTQASPNSKAVVKEWDISTKHFRSIAALQASDERPIVRPRTEPQFNAISFDEKESKLFVEVKEVAGRDPLLPIFVIRNSLKAIDMQSGQVTTVAKIQSASGLDFMSLN